MDHATWLLQSHLACVEQYDGCHISTRLRLASRLPLPMSDNSTCHDKYIPTAEVLHAIMMPSRSVDPRYIIAAPLQAKS